MAPVKAAVPEVPKIAPPPAAAGQFVVIAPDVVDSIGHVLGNLFQRLYHLVDLSRTDGAAAGDDLAVATRHLEGFLRTALDYLCPTTLTYQNMSVEDVVGGWAHQIGARTGGRVETEVGTRLPGVLRIDPAALRRSFALLAARLSPAAVAGAPVRLRAAAGPGNCAVAVRTLLPAGAVGGASSEREVEWALAEKLIELHGGTLRELCSEQGGTTWEIVLPTQ